MEKTDVSPNTTKAPSAAEDGCTVRVHYTGTLADGESFDSSEGKEPLEFKLGEHMVIKGFEDAVRGMKPGQKKTVELTPLQGYGDEDPALRQDVPKEAFGDLQIEEGMVLGMQHPAAPGPIPVRIVKIGEEKVTIDLNHPLAGKDLKFEIELVEIL